jgi:hypothetical protein
VSLADEAAKPPKAARSVHLGYEQPKDTPELAAFCVDMTVEKTVPGSYFMAAGFANGYFGIQERADGSKIAIFSVWDPTKGDDPKAVPDADRVEVIDPGEGVTVSRFGGEGTGGKSTMPFDWQTGKSYRFLVRCAVDGQKTAYTGFLWDDGKSQWRRMVTFKTRTGGHGLKGLYSFVEDFRRDTRSAGEFRRAAFGDAWGYDAAGKSHRLTRARFTASGASWEAKETIDAGIAGGRWYLQTGGDTKTANPLRTVLELPKPETEPTAPRPPDDAPAKAGSSGR